MGLVVRNLVKVFTQDNGLSARALDGLTLDVPSGSLTVIMGPNGSGKSTLFRILSGQLSADAGEVRLNDAPLHSRGRLGSEHRVAHVPQEPKTLAFPDMSLEEHLLWAEMSGRAARFWTRGVTPSRRARYRELLTQYRLDTLAEALPRPLRTLSVGWQQIFIVFMAANSRKLSGRQENSPEILLLDEPTSALDVENAKLCLELVSTYAMKAGRLLSLHTTVRLLLRWPNASMCSGRGSWQQTSLEQKFLVWASPV